VDSSVARVQRRGWRAALAVACAVLYPPGATVAAPADAATPTGEARLSAALDRLDTLEADFVQVLTDRDGRIVERSSGHLSLAKPWRFRWDYTEPATQLIVADGKRLWLYDRELEQVTVRPIDTTLTGTPAMLLSGKTPLADEFQAGPVEREADIDWIALAPVRDDTDFREVRIGLAGDTLRFMQLDDKLGQRTLLEFTNVEVNVPVDPGKFAFVPPPGADVIGADSTSRAE
jgi:outer membrane lipoprotein carrier protein